MAAAAAGPRPFPSLADNRFSRVRAELAEELGGREDGEPGLARLLFSSLTSKETARASLISRNAAPPVANSYHGHSEPKNRASSGWKHLSNKSSKGGEIRNTGACGANLPNKPTSSVGRGPDCSTIRSTRTAT